MEHESRLPGALAQMARATHALILRDIKTRFGSSYFGFLIGLLTPLAHIFVLLGIYLLLGRRAPIGTDVRIFLATALVPFVVWSYTHQKVMRSLLENRPLLSFPVIKMGDIALARAIVELLNASLIVLVVMATLAFLGVDMFVSDPPAALFALIMAYLLGLSTGLIFGCISLVTPGFMLVGFVIIPIYWASSGVFFIPDTLPEMVRPLLWVFPLAHIVDFLRMAIYPSYVTDFPSLLYVGAIIGGNVLIFLAAINFGKPILTSK